MKINSSIRLIIDKDRKIFNKSDIKQFSGNKLKYSSFTEIKTFEDVCNILGRNYETIIIYTNYIAKFSKTSAIKFKLDIICKALNLGKDLHFTKNQENSYIYYPSISVIPKNSTYYKEQIDLSEIEIIGKIKYRGEEYYVLGGSAIYSRFIDFNNLKFNNDFNRTFVNFKLLGCTKRKIAEHFGKYFGMLITEAKFGDLPNFKIIKDKYNNA